MNDPLRASYDAVPYRHGCVPLSHPARTGAIARLHGVSAAEPQRCRVLEIGCAEGFNLLPLAERFPHSEFTGVDFSTTQIAAGEAVRAACGLANARLLAADLRKFAPPESDYVIAHGVYSWVPAETADTLLAACAKALAPGGIAYVSYNTLPGWGVAGALRELLLDEFAGIAEPATRVEAARALAGTLDRAFEKQGGAWAALAREALGEMLAKPPALLLHDELDRTSTATTFGQFTAHAAGHGLHFLAEAHYASMPWEHLAAPVREALGDLPRDPSQQQRLLDFLGCRRFRASLLVKSAPAPLPDAATIAECAIGFRMSPASPQIELLGGPLRLTGAHGFTMDVTQPGPKAFFGALCQSAPGRVPFAAACARARDLLRVAGAPDALDEPALREGILRLFGMDQLDLVLAGDGAWLRSGDSPSPLMRHLARGGLPLANRWHESVALDAAALAHLASGAPADEMLKTAGFAV